MRSSLKYLMLIFTTAISINCVRPAMQGVATKTTYIKIQVIATRACNCSLPPGGYPEHLVLAKIINADGKPTLAMIQYSMGPGGWFPEWVHSSKVHKLRVFQSPNSGTIRFDDKPDPSAPVFMYWSLSKEAQDEILPWGKIVYYYNAAE